MTFLGVVVAGAMGAPARYLVDRAMARTRVGRRFPLGPLVVNVSGSLALGLLIGLALYHGLTAAPRVVLGAGFCGAYTTFSTYAYDTVVLADEGRGGWPPCTPSPTWCWARRRPPSVWRWRRCER